MWINIITMAHKIGDLVFNDIDKLLVDKILSEDKILLLPLIRTSLKSHKLTANLLQAGLNWHRN